MSLYKLLFFIALQSILCASCTKEVKYSKEAIFDLARSKDSSFTMILPQSMSEGIHCSDYSPGCISGHTVKAKGLEMIAVEFETEEQAKYAARKVRGYYVRNWLLDDVTGEPLLEAFALELQAKKP